jgi:hypothetical protein
MRIFFTILLIFIIPRISFGKVLDFEIFNGKKTQYKLEDVCNSVGANRSLLIDIVNYNSINCMGTKVSALSFCLDKNQDNPKFMRGYVDKNRNQIICQEGDRVYLEVSCMPGSDDEFCLKPEKSCSLLKKVLAHNLETIHQGISHERDQAIINCHFAVTNYAQSQIFPAPSQVLPSLH